MKNDYDEFLMTKKELAASRAAHKDKQARRWQIFLIVIVTIIIASALF